MHAYAVRARFERLFLLRLVTFFLVAVFAVPLLAQPAQAAKSFRTDWYDYFAKQSRDQIDALTRTVTKSQQALAADLAAAEAQGNNRNTAVVVEQILSKSPRDVALWTRLADLLLDSEPLNDQDRYELPGKALGAALNAYQLAKSKEDEAAALEIIARALAGRSDYRAALTAYKESLKLVDNEEIRAAYEQLRAEHGFRITDYAIESDALNPRVCFQFSDPLDRTQSDFTRYFTQEPGPVQAVTMEGYRLCVEGLKHGERYTLTARKGLPSGVDEPLDRDYDYEIYVRDRAPSVRFVGKAYVLPRVGQNGIPVVSVNTKAVKLKVNRVGDRALNSTIGNQFLQQLYGDAVSTITSETGQLVWEGSMETNGAANEDVTTAFPVDEALQKLEPGVYVMTAEAADRGEADYWEAVATQWFIVSDLGLTTVKGKDGLHVQVRSIATADPVSDVEVRVIARNNEVLATAKTDATGAAVVEAGLVKGTGSMEPLLVVAAKADDYAFLDMTQSAFDLTDRGVDGRDPPGAVDAFVYTERGVYRRGETVHVTALARDERANAMAGVPLTLVVERPDGVEYRRDQVADQGAGGRASSFTILSSGQSGTWRIRAYTDPKGDPVGETSFLVEDYIPDRIEFEMTSQSDRANRGSGALLALTGRYLFGSPAAGLDLEGDVTVSVDDAPFAAYAGYAFGLTDEAVENVSNTLEGLPQTDDKGEAMVPVTLPELPTTTRPLKIDIAIRMREPGGRPVEARMTLPIEPAEPMLGVKAKFDSYGVKAGDAAAFDVVALDPAGKPIAVTGASWTLKRLNTNYQWYLKDGSWTYEGVTTALKLQEGKIDIAADKPSTISQPLDWGQYRIEVEANGMAPVSSTFTVGYYASADAATPDTLNVALDKTSVKAGETLTVKIDSPFAGKATVSIVGDRLLAQQLVDVPAGGLAVPVTVGSDWGTGAYAVVTLHRPLDATLKRMPSRAIGLSWFGIGRDERTLGVTLGAVDTMKPRGPLSVPVKIDGLTAGEKAYVTVAAVDVGILNLTDYQTPAPDSFYFDQKRLAAEIRDVYGLLIDGMQGQRGRLRSGGDGGASDLGGSPPSQAPLSLFSGVVEVAADGSATVSFDIPAFNGSVRLMAVAWSAGKVGHAEKDVIVRDPVVIAGTLPRFLADGDTSRFRLDLINAEAVPGDYTLAVSIDGPLSAEPAALYQTVKIGEVGARVPVNIPIKASGTGIATLVATLAGPGGVSIDQTYVIGVRPPNPPVARRTIRELAAKGGSITLSNDLLAEMAAGTGRVTLSVGPLTELDVPGLLAQLDRYPYGCSEQIVSRAMPLLYLSDLGGGEMAPDEGVQQRLAEAVERLLNRQDSAGAFGLWDSYGGDLWLSAYVTDFLLRAREKGFEVPESQLTQAVDYLRNRVGNAPDVESGGGQDMAYALYTLARAGRAPAGDLKYLTDTKLAEFGSPLAKAQVGAALAMIGDRARAERAFAAATGALATASADNARASRSDYGSVLRDAAAIVALGGDSTMGATVIKTAGGIVAAEAGKRRYYSTQDMAWMVLAARSVMNEAQRITLTADGAAQTGAFYRNFDAGDLAKPFTVSNPSDDALKAVVTVNGSPKTPEPAENNGMYINQTFFFPDGTPIEDMSKLPQNTRIVVVLEAGREGNDATGRFLLVDHLPAGLEIENPNLIGSGNTANLPWLSGLSYVTYSEFRDDRFVTAFNDDRVKVAYMARTVTPGTYVYPSATVEDMYRPDLFARTASTTLTVVER